MSDILDSILDSTLDDLADLPEVKPWPAGVHIASLSLEAKEINKKPTVFAHLTHIATSELSNPTDASPAEGDKTSVMMMLKNNDGAPNEIAQGQLKAILLKLKSAGVPGDTNRDIIANTKDGIVVGVVTGQRENKQNGTFNTTIVKLEVQA